MTAQATPDSTQCVGNFQVQMLQQGCQFGVQFVSNSTHSPIEETTELIAGLVDREERLSIGPAPYHWMKWCVHHDGRLESKHLLHDAVIAHEVGNRRTCITGEANYPIDVISPIDEESPWRCFFDKVNHLGPWRSSSHQFPYFLEW